MKIFNEGLRKRIIAIIIVVIAFATISMTGYLMSVKKYQNDVKNITFAEINMEDIKDGIYVGDCDVNFIYAKVQVTVKNGKLENIELLEHKNERGAAAERIVKDIKETQNIDVDVVSGATNSSIVIKKAVENALIEAAFADTK